MTLRGQILSSRTDDDTALPSVCTFRTFPCILPPRAHVEKHARELLACTGTFRMYTCRFSACYTTPHIQHNTLTQNHTTVESITQHHTERERESETVKEERGRRQKARLIGEDRRGRDKTRGEIKRADKRQDEKQEREEIFF